MRILQIAQKPQRRGAEVFCFELSAALRERSNTVRVVYLYRHGGDRPLPLHHDDRQLAGRERHPLERLPGLRPSLLNAVREQIADFAPDIVQVNGSRSVKYGTMARRLAGRDAPWRLVYRNIGDPKLWNRRRLQIALYRRLFMTQVDGVISVSQASLDNAVDLYGFDGVPREVIPGGIDVEQLRPRQARSDTRQQLTTPADAVVVVAVGGIVPEKRPDRLLRAFAAARQQAGVNLVLWFVGDGVLRPEMQALAASLGVAEAVRFAGYQEDVASFLAAADVFALASDTEGTPAVVLEAGYLRLPVVATAVGGIPECIKDGETGLLAAREDEAAFADHLRRLATGAELRRTMGAAAHDWVDGRFTLDVVAQRYEAFYQRVLSETRATP